MHKLLKFFAISFLITIGIAIKGMEDDQKQLSADKVNWLEILPSDIWSHILNLSCYNSNIMSEMPDKDNRNIYEGLEYCLSTLFQRYLKLRTTCKFFNERLLNLNENPAFRKGLQNFYSPILCNTFLSCNEMLNRYDPKQGTWHDKSKINKKIGKFIFKKMSDPINTDEKNSIFEDLGKETLFSEKNNIDVISLEKLISLLLFFEANCEGKNSAILMTLLFFNPENLKLLTKILARNADEKVTLTDKNENLHTCLSALYLGLVTKFNQSCDKLIPQKYKIPHSKALPVLFFNIPKMKERARKNTAWWNNLTQEDAQSWLLYYAKTKNSLKHNLENDNIILLLDVILMAALSVYLVW